MKNYEVTVYRDGRWWMVEIPALDGLTQTRRLDDAELVATEYIAAAEDLAMSEVSVEITSIDADGIDAVKTRAMIEGLRAQAEAIDAQLSSLRSSVAVALTAAKVPARDIGKVLDVSFQRVSQIVNAAAIDAVAAQKETIKLLNQEVSRKIVASMEVTSPAKKVSRNSPKYGRAIASKDVNSSGSTRTKDGVHVPRKRPAGTEAAKAKVKVKEQ